MGNFTVIVTRHARMNWPLSPIETEQSMLERRKAGMSNAMMIVLRKAQVDSLASAHVGKPVQSGVLLDAILMQRVAILQRPARVHKERREHEAVVSFGAHAGLQILHGAALRDLKPHVIQQSSISLRTLLTARMSVLIICMSLP